VAEAMRRLADGRYACMIDAAGMVVETPAEPEDGRDAALRSLIQENRAALLGIARVVAGESPEDPFADWHQDEFLVAVVNERAALVVVCADAEALKAASAELLNVWVDRALRYDERYRLDARGGGFFFGRPRLDVVAVGGAAE
jgi:hypothetical protein